MNDLEIQSVYKTAYDLLGQMIELSKTLDKYVQDPFGFKTKSLSYHIAFNIKCLNINPDWEEMLPGIQQNLRELAFVLQVLRDRKQISVRSFVLNNELIVSVSRQLEGLVRR